MAVKLFNLDSSVNVNAHLEKRSAKDLVHIYSTDHNQKKFLNDLKEAHIEAGDTVAFVSNSNPGDRNNFLLHLKNHLDAETELRRAKAIYLALPTKSSAKSAIYTQEAATLVPFPYLHPKGRNKNLLDFLYKTTEVNQSQAEGIAKVNNSVFTMNKANEESLAPFLDHMINLAKA